MNWFERLWYRELNPMAVFISWSIVIIALINEAIYLHNSHIIYMVLFIMALVWLLLIEPCVNIPYIYFVKETGLFLYARSSQRITFDYLTLFTEKDNSNLFGGVNNLNIAKPDKLSDTSSYLVFDNNSSAVAVVRHQRWYGTNDADAKVILVDPNGAKRLMTMGNFIENQIQILREIRAKQAESK